ncbi:MAG: 50S ribosomal protein L11 methyltransferase [Nitrospirae bacterium]|nr:50S ribosomal protein L11 methyltransferase [Nitrospirota bacterium]
MILIMSYIHIKINLSDNAREPIIFLLNQYNMKGVFEDEFINAYFDESSDIDKISESISELLEYLKKDQPDTTIKFSVDRLPETDWNEEWKKSFVPINIGKRLVVTPPWLKSDKSSRIEIIVDPAMAFGTGHHETTARCLLLIEELSQISVRSGFLDLGAGTGILSIAASKLGFKKVVAIDNDSMAEEAATLNIAHNRLNNIELITGTIEHTDQKFDLIAANIISETLIDIADKIIERLSFSGTLILSGMINGQQEDVIKKYTNSGLRLLETFHDGKWITLTMRRCSI